MFQKLRSKWNVNSTDLILILCTFALGGSACGYLGKKAMGFIYDDKNVLYWVLYIVIVTILWPLCVYIISFFFGQQKFFKNYIAKIIRRLSGQ